MPVFRGEGGQKNLRRKNAIKTTKNTAISSKKNIKMQIPKKAAFSPPAWGKKEKSVPLKTPELGMYPRKKTGQGLLRGLEKYF